MSIDIQGINPDGDAFWSVGVDSWVEALAYLARSRPLRSPLTSAVLLRHGPQLEQPDDCSVIGPYRLAPAQCRHCGGQAGAA